MAPPIAPTPSMATDRFSVELDELLRVVDGMAACERELRELAEELGRRVRALHETWEGSAAVAQQSAQLAWESGFRGMREALGRMRTAGRAAHEHYAGALATNVAMWEQLR